MLIALIILTISLLPKTQASASNWVDFESKNTDELQKEWKIRFSGVVDEATVNEKNEYVEDTEKNLVTTTYRVVDDEVFIKPVAYYTSGQTFPLFQHPRKKAMDRPANNIYAPKLPLL